MNKDQVKGTLKDAAGKVQQTTGKVIGSHEQQAKGLKKQVEGQAQKAVDAQQQAGECSVLHRGSLFRCPTAASADVAVHVRRLGTANARVCAMAHL